MGNDLWSLVKGRMNYGRKSEHYALERHPWKHGMLLKIMLKIFNNA